jgi:sarcosine oxidase subunit alpha
LRITSHPVLGYLPKKRLIRFSFNDKKYNAAEGESIAAALLANRIRVLRYTENKNEPRGIYCGIGHCYECRVTVNGISGIRSCITPVKEGMGVISEGSEHHEKS